MPRFLVAVIPLVCLALAAGCHSGLDEDELVRVGARVGDDGKLQDAGGKPIRFFALTGCWGNPPGNYQEILDDQNRRLDELRKTNTVITLTCNPSGMPIP
jgi:hypothetical protein